MIRTTTKPGVEPTLDADVDNILFVKDLNDLIEAGLIYAEEDEESGEVRLFPR